MKKYLLEEIHPSNGLSGGIGHSLDTGLKKTHTHIKKQYFAWGLKHYLC